MCVLRLGSGLVLIAFVSLPLGCRSSTPAGPAGRPVLAPLDESALRPPTTTAADERTSTNGAHALAALSDDPPGGAGAAPALAAATDDRAFRTDARTTPGRRSRRPAFGLPDLPGARRRGVGSGLEPDLRIGAPTAALVAGLRQSATNLEPLCVPDTAGSVVYLDQYAAERVWVLSQRSARELAGMLRVNLDLRSRGAEQLSQVRVLFFDEKGRVVGSSPVTERVLRTYFSHSLSVTCPDPRAAYYLVLIDAPLLD